MKGQGQASVYFTTLFDLYGLPDDFPGKSTNVRNPHDPGTYAVALENEFGADIGHLHFIPHLQLHEYETMLFASPDAFAISFENCEAEILRLEEVAASFPTIEHIDDGADTAPSKRIIELIPEYAGRKSTAGPDIAEYIGLPTIRAKCPHFDAWLTRLESLDWDARPS